jgi:nucleoid DNA-binding protein
LKKEELIKELATKTGAKKAIVATVLNAYGELLVEAVKKDGEVVVGKLGKFKLKNTKEQKMKLNFGKAKGTEITVPAGKRVTFFVSKFFKDNIK